MTTTTLNKATGRLLALAFLLAAIAASLMLAAGPSYASTTFTVKNTNDTGVGSLRQAMFDANVIPGADVINFDIPGSEVKTIAPASPLPTITGPVTINGYSQTGAHPNTRAVGSDAALKIELSGASAPPDADGLWITAANSTVRGLVINRWGTPGSLESAIHIEGSDATGNRIAGNYVGTDASGTKALGNTLYGVYIDSGSNNIIGGTSAAE